MEQEVLTTFKDLGDFVRTMNESLNDYDEAIEKHGPDSYDARDCEEALQFFCRSAIAQNLVPEFIEIDAYRINKETRGTIIYKQKITWNHHEYPEEIYWLMRKELDDKGIDW